MRYVLLTRAQKENRRLASELDKRNIKSISLPLLSLRKMKLDYNTQDYKYIIITSKFAASLAAKNIYTKILALVVGKESSLILDQNSMIKVLEVFNTVKELKDFIENTNLEKSFLYLSGNNIKTNMPEFVDRQIIYYSSYRSKLATGLKYKILNYQIKTILIYSENSAKTFIRLCYNNGIIEYIKNITFITLSINIKQVLDGYASCVLACQKPSNNCMLEILYKTYV